MSQDVSALGLPIGPLVADWRVPPAPTRTPMQGRYCRLEPLDPARHAAELFAAYREDSEDRLWTYLPYGPFASQTACSAWLDSAAASSDPLAFTIIDARTQRAVGIASYMRIDTKNGVIEVGGITYAPCLQRTPVATEAMYLMMKHIFDLGYRRYEWKCNALNAPSRRAALRLGFSFEGVFRQAAVVKGRSRDTAWFSLLDNEWPTTRAAFEAWLDPTNFDAQGQQQKSLASLRAALHD